uniref:Calmodulin-lysine N-methyltransferase n=1 Tax=Skeletonema marinoi TaxID=267567 RepID=A0A7S2KDF5_9STRA|mmetsp:Transcript_11819/g.20080  ORF Transcript_11819/g.20080 Transcript_11819/m.20080 type:complete len:324 (+) Transcript_11819:117-1088(+)
MGNDDDENDSIDEQDYQLQLARDIFRNPEDDEDEWLGTEAEHDGISELKWTCPINTTGADDISIVYHLAFLAPGHGDSLWNSSRCIAEHILDPKRRAVLLGILLLDNEQNGRKFSWPPKTCLEFGAGAALPSLALLHAGAQKVVFTDRYVNEQTFDALKLSIEKNALAWNIGEEEIGRRTAIAGHTWGEEIEILLKAVAASETNDADGSENENAQHVDLLIASDCIYNPTYHAALLQSASALIEPSTGIFIVGYSLHGNVPTSHVERFFTEAKQEYGLEVVHELLVEYSEGQMGIGSVDEERGNVYLKILACRDSVHCKDINS